MVQLLGAEDLQQLLQSYRASADLSQVTKSEKAGVLYLFTRDEIEKMQARTLKDLFKTLPILIYTRSYNNIVSFERQGAGMMSGSHVRIFINDHDVTSTSFGNGLFVWGDAPVEMFDHIEVYRNVSAIEFGIEAGVVIIRLYTKDAQRDEGSKVRGYVDSRKGFGGDLYQAILKEDGSNYFAYLHGANVRNREYHHRYGGYEATIKNGNRDGTAFMSYEKGMWHLEAALMGVDSDPFLGQGAHATPSGEGGLRAWHGYGFLQRRFDSGMRLIISYDHLDYRRTYDDPNKLYASAVDRLVTHYKADYIDEIVALECDGHWGWSEADNVYGGGFIKYKTSDIDADYDGIGGKSDTTLWLGSIFGEWTHRFDAHLQGVAGFKYDRYDYEGKIDDRNHLITRGGLVYMENGWMAKFFVISTYVPTPVYQLADIQALPGIDSAANPHLKDSSLLINMLRIRREFDRTSLGLKIAQGLGKNSIVYDSGQKSFLNLPGHYRYRYLEGDYEYRFDSMNYLKFDLSKGFSKDSPTYAPPMVMHARLFNSFERWDIYNELSWYQPNEKDKRGAGGGFDYTVALKHHFNKALSIGVRGENLFDSGYKRYYRTYGDTIVVYDRRVVLNVGYNF